MIKPIALIQHCFLAQKIDHITWMDRMPMFLSGWERGWEGDVGGGGG